MKRFLVLWVLMLSAANAFAQVEDNRLDISGGYLLEKNDGSTAHGWHGSLAERVRKSVYIVGMVSGSYLSESGVFGGLPLNVEGSGYTFAGGPRIFMRRHDVLSPFADLLLGGFHSSATGTTVLPSGGTASATSSVNGFVISFGAGSDLRVNDLLSVRVRPAYDLMRVAGSADGQFSFQAGIVFHLKR